MSKKKTRQLGQSTSELTTLNEKVLPYLKSLGYSYIDFDMQVNSNGRLLEADAVVYVDIEKKKPFIVIEVKHSIRLDITLLDPAVQHAFSIATILGEQARYLLVTDGNKYEWFERSGEGQSLSHLRHPPYAPEESINTEQIPPSLETLDLEKYATLIRAVIDALRKEGLILGLRMGLELNRILIAKIYDEKTAAQYGERRFRAEGDALSIASRIRQLYEEAMGSLNGNKLEENWTLSAETLLVVARILEPYSLTSLSQSVLERSFWREFQNLLTKEERQFTTPVALAEFLVKLADPVKEESIIDPACGSGLFLLEAFDYISSQIDSKSNAPPSRDRIRHRFNQNITGVEVNSTVAELASTNFVLNGLSPNRIVKANSLQTDELEQANIFANSYDLVLMNPPFGPAPKNGDVFREFEVSRLGGKIRLEVLFLERAIRLLRPGGRIAILVPDSFLSAPALRNAREWLLNYMLPKAIVSLPPESFAPVGHLGKASVMLLEKKHNQTAGDGQVFLAEVRAVGYDRFGLPAKENDLPRVIEMFGRFKKGEQILPLFNQEQLRVWQSPISEMNAARLDITQLTLERDETLRALNHSPYPTVRIKEVAEIISGRNFKEYIEEGSNVVAVIQAGAVRELEILTSSCPFISYQEYEAAKRAQVQNGDVLITTTGHYLGRAAVVEDLTRPSVISSAVTILRPSSEIDSLFLAAILNSDIGRQQISNYQASATAQPYIRRADLGQILIPLPPLEKQKEIAYRIRQMLTDARELKQRAQALEAESRALVVAELLGVNDYE